MKPVQTKALPFPWLSKIEEFVGDMLFPRSCLGCGAPDTYLCDQCIDRIPRRREHDCPICQKTRTPDGATCLSCRKRSALGGAFSAAVFRENRIISDAVHVLKYEYVPDLAEPLGRLLATRARESEFPLPDLIIPVPLHPWRERYRGFNQSMEIARYFSTHFFPELSIPLRDDILRRTRFTLPQARSHGAKERRKNLRGAFTVDPSIRKRELRGQAVWLIDDVATTGATLEECARVLKRSGASSIHGLVIAR